MHRIKELSEMKDRFMRALDMAMDAGIENLDTKEAGEVTDMIKDLAQAEKYCAEAKYYCTVVEAMEEGEMDEFMEEMVEMNERRGYNPNRSASSGRYTSGGRSRGGSGRSSSGSTGSSGRGGSGGSGNSGGSMGGSRGYPVDFNMENMPDEMRGQYDGIPERMRGDIRYGQPYNEYKKYKRNYTESKSMTDKTEMDKHAMEHVKDTIGTLKEIWSGADPELKRKMKNDMNSLISDMN